ncbi:MAG TPA: TetR/AcrR family transcriptional regulator, partial [Stellaceae bacterium]|nr:TetR/AcrR family transcriptional regulator [Stellaceae bacterium]
MQKKRRPDSLADGAPAADEDWSFVAVLHQAAASPGLAKTERTRLRLLAAIAARLSTGVEATALRVSDIAADAAVAHGTFYRYFADRRMAVEALVADFVRFLRDRLAESRDGPPGSRARVRSATLTYVRLFRDNAGLMRCLMELGSEGAGFRNSFHALNRAWNGRVATAIAHRRAALAGTPPLSAAAMLPIAYALGGMIDEFLAQLYLRRDPTLAGLARDEAAIADLLTELWCRGAYG